jgi:hypothetical protein
MEAAALLCFVKLTCLLFPAPPAATTTLLLRSQTVCFALVLLREERILARVTVEAPSSALRRFFSVWCLLVMAVLCLASPVSTPELALFHLSLPATYKKVIGSRIYTSVVC